MRIRHSSHRVVLSLFLLLRPYQWVKNVAVFAPLVFGGRLFDLNMFLRSLSAFGVICVLSSSHYVINDIVDRMENRMHPTKRHRPIAAGTVSVRTAWIIWGVLTATALASSFIISTSFAFVCIAYSVLHYLLLFVFRYQRILDIMALATGYALRLLAGQVATGIHISVWLSMSAFCLALLFAIGKRRYDSVMDPTLGKRKATGKYSPLYSTTLLDAYMAMFATATFVSYTYFTFLTTFVFDTDDPSAGFGFVLGRKWLMATVPFALFFIMRYLQRMYVIEGHSSHQWILMTDIPLLISIFGWAATTVLVIYGIGR